MKILIDIQGAQNLSSKRGIGRYTRSFTKAIIKNKKSHSIYLLLNNLFPDTINEIKNEFKDILPKKNLIIFNAVGPVDQLNTKNHWNNEVSELIREKFIFDFSPDFLIISSLFEGAMDNTITSIKKYSHHTPTATILYDLIPFISPEKYISAGPTSQWYYGKIDSLQKSDVLLAISSSAKKEAIKHLNYVQKKITNISSAVDQSFFIKKKVGDELRKKYNITKPFIMHTSAFEERKNFERLIEAFSLLKNNLSKEYQLVLVCKLHESQKEGLYKLSKKCGIEDNGLILTDFVPDEDLRSLYSDCYLFVFPSMHEGFGLPALEAMSCGAATIGSNTSSIPEVIGLTDALFDPSHTEDMVKKIEHALIDKLFYKKLKNHALKQAAKFSWDKSARKAISFIENKYNTKKNHLTVDESTASLIDNIIAIKTKNKITDDDLIKLSTIIEENELIIQKIKTPPLKWRIEGPFDSSYSLALLNRETARALKKIGHLVILHSTEGPGDFVPNEIFLKKNPDLKKMNNRVNQYPHEVVDIVSRNLYPPRVEDMNGQLNLLHHYAWEESGFPQEWVDNFNSNLDGITCLSKHVEKILIDNGVSIPLVTSGCGVDHLEHINTDKEYILKTKSFKFLHVSSCFPRKGINILLEAYGNCFTKYDNVSLVIKTFSNPHNSIHKLLEEKKIKNENYPDTIIIEDELSNSKIKALYQQCDVLVAPSCAEGFGLPMAEAMLNGLPVITTNWSGQLDFCNNENSWLVDYSFERAESHFNLFSSVWAKPNIKSLEASLKESFSTSKKNLTKKAFLGRQLLLEKFKWVDITAKAANAAQTLKNIHKENKKNNIGWISTWNTKCGIATYSEHLISFMPKNTVTVFSPIIKDKINKDSSNCIRSWNTGKNNNNLNKIIQHNATASIDSFIIQFNYGFFNFEEFNLFIDSAINLNKNIILMMHSTIDPFPLNNDTNWKLQKIHISLIKCHRILVHNISDLNRLKNIGVIDNVALFPHGVINYNPTKKHKKSSTKLIATYGFFLPHKGLKETVSAINILRKKGLNIKLRMVNAKYPDKVSTIEINKTRDLIKKLELQESIELHTSFLKDTESLELLQEADIVIYPYQETGESVSGAVRYGMATKRPVAVPPLNIFDDLGSSVFHFSGTTPIAIANGIEKFLNDLSSNSESCKNIFNEAERWRKEHEYEKISNRLYNICTALNLKRNLFL